MSESVRDGVVDRKRVLKHKRKRKLYLCTYSGVPGTGAWLFPIENEEQAQSLANESSEHDCTSFVLAVF